MNLALFFYSKHAEKQSCNWMIYRVTSYVFFLFIVIDIILYAFDDNSFCLVINKVGVGTMTTGRIKHVLCRLICEFINKGKLYS
jgi:hypothetical protein